MLNNLTFPIFSSLMISGAVILDHRKHSQISAQVEEKSNNVSN